MQFYFLGGLQHCGGLSYDMNKNPSLQDSPPAAGRSGDILPFRRSASLPGGLFIS